MLRTRLMSGLLCLLIILLAMGLYSINQCSELGQRIEKISKDNDQVGRNLQQMKRSGASLTEALLTRVAGDEPNSRRDFNAAARSFQDALDAQNSREIPSPEEKALITRLGDTYQAYLVRARAFLQSPESPHPAWQATAARLGQDTARMLDLVDQLNLAHENAISEGNKTSAAAINKTFRFLILLMIVALAAFLTAYIGLSRGLLNPLKSLTASIKQVGEGNLDQTVPVVSKDELGVLAVSFNQMAAQLRQYQASTSVELLRLNQTIRATLASFPDPIFVLNSEGAVEFRNPAADQLAVKLLFSGVTRLPAKVDEKVEEVRASGQDYLPTLFHDAVKFHIDGQDRYFLPRVVLLRTEKRETFGVAVILENVTRMLLLDDVKSNLIATVSHELKTPLTSVRMALYLLFEKTVGSLNEKQTDLVAAAREDADRLLQTLNDLLDLAKLEQGPTLLQLKPVSPAELVETAERATREIAHAATLALKTRITPDLPDVRIDPQRVAYVLINLITNAIKYSPPGGEVQLSAQLGQMRSSRPSVRFSVRDQGPGIAPEHQEHIFERFYRVPGTKTNGAGLGLSIAREIVVAHQGEIGVLSQPGKGSEFFFVLPLGFEQAPS
jgi:NtrC-family two-component system sensor histidine kinase KinB